MLSNLKCRQIAVAVGPEPAVSDYQATCANQPLVEPPGLAAGKFKNHVEMTS